MKDDWVYLNYIVEYIERIENSTAKGKEAFLLDQQAMDAVLRNLHTLTEITTRVTQSLKIKYPEVDWRNIALFRNVVVHDYMGIDMAKIWEIVEKDLPLLKSTIIKMIQGIQKN